MTELRRLSTDCAFGDTLSDMLRDRLVCGINEEKIQRRLLQEVNLTFEDALRIARAMETAAKNSLEMQRGGFTSTAPQAPVAVHQTSSRRDHTPGKSKCSRCLGWHLPKPCKKRGHIARACRSQSNQQGESKAAHQISQEEDFQESEEMLETAMNAVHIVGRGNEVKPLKVEVLINQQKVEMEIDTEAAVTLVNEATFKALWSKRKALICVGHKYNYRHIQGNH